MISAEDRRITNGKLMLLVVGALEETLTAVETGETAAARVRVAKLREILEECIEMASINKMSKELTWSPR